jgi:hypothetical protein
MSLAERVYRMLLGLYPKDFRERYALEMMQTFRDAHRQAVLEHRTFGFWFGTLTDAISSAIREHAQRIGGSMSPIVRVGAVCFVIGGLLDMFRSSQLVWGDLSAFGPGSVEGISSRIIGALAIAGLQVARTSPMNRLEKAGFAIVWLGFLLGSLHDAAMALLNERHRPDLDSCPHGDVQTSKSDPTGHFLV